MTCEHPNKEVSGQYREKDAHGMMRTVRSYACPDCGENWSDLSPKKKEKEESMPKNEKTKAKPVKAKADPKPAAKPAAKPTPKPPAKKLEQKELSARTISAQADKRFAVGKVYEQDFTPRRGKYAGKTVTCKLDSRVDGYYDQDGTRWDTPTALTTSFAHKYLGQSEDARRPAAHFFSHYKLWAPPAEGKGKGTGGKAKAPKAKAAPKPAKAKAAPKAKPTPEPAEEKPAETCEPETSNDDLAPPDLD